MINFALPYVVIISLFWIATSNKTISKNYLIASNFIYSLLCLLFLSISIYTDLVAWYTGVIYEIFAFMYRINGYQYTWHFIALLLVTFPAQFFLHSKFRSNIMFCVIVILCSLIGIYDWYLFPEKIYPGWNTLIIPVLNGYFMAGSSILLSLGAILLVQFNLLPEFRRSNNTDILD